MEKQRQKPFYKMIDEICKEKNINQQLLSYGWIRELKKNNKIRNIIGYQFDLNPAAAYEIASDKFATYEILNSNNIPTIPHKMIFNPKSRSLYYSEKFLEEVVNLLKENNNKVVIKANDSCKGKDVHFCSNEHEIKNVVLKLFEENNATLSACPYMDIDYEYRLIYLCGEILYVYKKKKPYVIGDGQKDIGQLIKDKFGDYNIDICQDLNLEVIPSIGEEVTVSWKHNLNSGAEPVIVDENEEFIDEIKEIGKKAGNVMNIKFASIDIALTVDKKILIMEINGSVCMNKFTEIIPNGYDIAKSIYSKAIDKMFE